MSNACGPQSGRLRGFSESKCGDQEENPTEHRAMGDDAELGVQPSGLQYERRPNGGGDCTVHDSGPPTAHCDDELDDGPDLPFAKNAGGFDRGYDADVQRGRQAEPGPVRSPEPVRPRRLRTRHG